jgi:hypothetical protein
LPQPWLVDLHTLLTGHEALPDHGQPGLPLDLILTLEKSDDVATQTELHFALGDRAIEEKVVELSQGGPWRVAVRLSLPEDLLPGDYPLRVRGVSDQDWLDLGDISIASMPEMQATLDISFTNGIVLEGWNVDSDEKETTVTLLWRTNQPQDQTYSVFVHLLDANGQIIAQHDSQPDNGRYPTTVWPAGVTVPDRHRLETAVQSDMTLRIGLYLPGSGLRVALPDGTDTVDRALKELSGQ